MSYFDTILSNHHFDHCPLPLWKIKVTDEEYDELKRLLSNETRALGRMPFMSVTRECVLLYAEYWRREYKEGSHSKQMVFDALPDALPNLAVAGERIDMCEQLYQAARKGAKRLGIEILSFGNTHYLESMLYQGGLPMQMIVGSDANGVWERFLRGLVFKNVNFNELDLGIVATNSISMRTYCNQLCDAVDARQYKLLPFYAENENNSWYQFLINRFNNVRKRERMTHPFTIDWDFVIDEREKKISAKYDLKGTQKLSEAFMEQQRLKKEDTITVNILKNGKVIDGFDYYNSFCRYAVRSRHTYRNGDVVSLYIHDQEQPHISESLDMDTPHLLYRDADGSCYKMGNHIGKEESFLLIPEGWDVENEKYQIYEYAWDDIIFRGMRIPIEHSGDIILSGPDGVVTYGNDKELYWTELCSSPLYTSNVDEPLYNAANLRLALCHDGNENVIKQLDRPAEYRSKWGQTWSDIPSYGEIKARVKTNTGMAVTPIKFINVGDGLKISVIDANDSTCQIKVEWPYGKVACNCGAKQANDVWLVKKEDCENKHKIPFTLTPTTNHQNAFTIHIKAPFREFTIEDAEGQPISSGCTIPYVDVERYQYHLVGMNIPMIKFGKEECNLKWSSGTLYLHNRDKRIPIPYEGNLSRLFGSRDVLRKMLDKTSMSILDASVPVRIELSDNRVITFSIKESPYRPNERDGKITISCNWQPVNYQHTLNLLSLNDPQREPKEIVYDKVNGYVVPQEISEWGKTLVIGRSRGRICQTMIDLTEELTFASRINNRETAIQQIIDELQNAKIGDKTWNRILSWFENCQKFDIPASSLLDLTCVANKQEYLICFAFQLWASTDDKDILCDKLQIFAKDLAFEWFWLIPKATNGTFAILARCISDPSCDAMVRMFSQWAINRGTIELLYTINTESYFENFMVFMQESMIGFTEWLKKLCMQSACQTYESNRAEDIEFFANHIVFTPKNICTSDGFENQYVETNQDDLDDETHQFFKQYSERNKSNNEAWLYQRVNALHKHLIGEVDIFAMPLKARRSIAFCHQATTNLFLLALNNKLSKKNYI